jgi:hypothetical protein
MNLINIFIKVQYLRFTNFRCCTFTFGISSLLLILILGSCKQVQYAHRKNLDIPINETNYYQLKGIYQNKTIDTNQKNNSFSNQFLENNYSTIDSFELQPINNKKLLLRFFNNSTIIDSLTIKGKFKDGYFKVNRLFYSSFIVPPIIWMFGHNIKLIGLQHNQNLVVLHSGGSGYSFFIAIPYYVAGSSGFETVFKKIR